MSKQTELFRVQNSEWKIAEQADGTFQLLTSDGTKKLQGLTGRQAAALVAVASETDRYLRSKG